MTLLAGCGKFLVVYRLRSKIPVVQRVLLNRQIGDGRKILRFLELGGAVSG
jgi:hypothetical protein